MIGAIDSKISLPTISFLHAIKMLVLAWNEVTDRIVKNCFKEADFSEIKDDDAVSNDLFASTKVPITQFSILDKTFEDATVEDVESFDDMLVSTQELVSDEYIFVGLSAVDIDDQYESAKDDSQS